MQPEIPVTIFESPYAPRELPNRAISVPGQLSHDGSYAIQSVLRVLSRRRKWIAGAIGFCLVVAVVATLFMKPVYEATATIELNKGSAGSLDLGLGESGQAPSGGGDLGTDLETETAILESDSLALAVIHQLNLGSQAPFWVGSFSAAGARAEDSPEERARMLEVFKQGLKVKPVRGTRLTPRRIATLNTLSLTACRPMERQGSLLDSRAAS